jgi:hypothetical protein
MSSAMPVLPRQVGTEGIAGCKADRERNAKNNQKIKN